MAVVLDEVAIRLKERSVESVVVLLGRRLVLVHDSESFRNLEYLRGNGDILVTGKRGEGRCKQGDLTCFSIVPAIGEAVRKVLNPINVNIHNLTQNIDYDQIPLIEPEDRTG